MRSKTAKYILIMTLWWIMLFFIRALVEYPISQFLSSYYPFFIAFSVTLLVCLMVSIIELKTDYWARSGFWTKYIITNGVYTLNVFIILAITILLDSFRLIGYFDGDPEGSFGMLYFPSIFFYLVLGVVLRILNKSKNRVGG